MVDVLMSKVERSAFIKYHIRHINPCQLMTQRTMSNQTSFNLISNDIFVGNMMDSFMEGSDDFHPYLDIDEFDMSFEDDLEFVDCVEGQKEHEHVQDRRRLSLTFMRRLSISSASPEEFCQQRRNSITDSRESYGSEVTPVSSTSSARHSSVLSLLSAAELEQQLEQTKSRLTQSMERSELSRQQINSQASHSAVPASVLSQSRDRFASYMGGMTSMTRTLG